MRRVSLSFIALLFATALLSMAPNGTTHRHAVWAADAVTNDASEVTASTVPGLPPDLQIIPLPQELRCKAGEGFQFDKSAKIMANAAPDAREKNMAEQLQRKIWDTTGHLLPIVYGGSVTSNVVAAGTPDRCPAVKTIIAEWPEVAEKAAKTEGYVLAVKDSSIVIRGFDDAGTFYGSQTLIQLLEHYKESEMPSLFCYDYPELAWRGVYFRVKWEHDWAFTKELISEMFARYKMNRIAPEIHMRSESYPEIPLPNDNPVKLANAKEFLDFCRLHYITDIITWYPGPPQGLPSTGPEECTLDPERVARMRQMYADDVKYLNASYIHTHLSEISTLGCPEERAVHSNEWMYNTMLWQHYDATYKALGVQPLIWGDMLRPDWPARFKGDPVHGAIATMPPMIIADWEYGLPGEVATDYPSLDLWIKYGKKALGVPYGFGLYDKPGYNERYGDKENIYYWANAVYKRSHEHPDLMLGILAFNKYMVKDRSQVFASPFDQQVLGCFPYYGEWGWNPDGRDWNPYPYGNGWSAVMRGLAPARVSDLKAVRSGDDVTLRWTNPADAEFTGAYIVYRTDRHPASPLDGTLLADIDGRPSASASYAHKAAPSRAFYSVFAHDSVRHFSPGVSVAR